MLHVNDLNFLKAGEIFMEGSGIYNFHFSQSESFLLQFVVPRRGNGLEEIHFTQRVENLYSLKPQVIQLENINALKSYFMLNKVGS